MKLNLQARPEISIFSPKKAHGVARQRILEAPTLIESYKMFGCLPVQAKPYTIDESQKGLAEVSVSKAGGSRGEGAS